MSFYQNLITACQTRNISLSALLVKCKLSKSYGTFWKKGKYPTLDVAAALSEELNVSMDYLTFGCEVKPSQEQQYLIDLFSQLSEIDQAKLLERAKTLAELESEKNIPK